LQKIYILPYVKGTVPHRIDPFTISTY